MRFSVGALIVAITHGCGGDKVATSEKGSADLTAKPEGPAKVAAPVTPGLADAGPAKPPSAAFAAESRDPAWAAETEGEIKNRWSKIRGGKLGELECRHSLCRLVVTGSEGDVGQAIADLGGHRGMHGYAKIILGAPKQKPDGTVELLIHAEFER
jgi:hypothetical protein